jgi:hypothetical protein
MEKFHVIAPDGNVIKLSRSLSGVEAILLASAPLSQRSSAQPNGLSCKETLNLTALRDIIRVS